MKKQKWIRKGMAFVLSLAMVAGLVPAMSGGANTVQAATGSGTEPSVTAYATKDQLMNAFKPNSDGTATTTGKLVFGHNSSSNAQEWYILGKDTGVSGDNTIIFAASPIATEQAFNSDTSDKTYDSTTVNADHYGASDLRVALKDMADGSDTAYFTSAEQGLMNATTVTTNDTKNGGTYTTTDKLYALAADGYGSTTIKAGTNNQTVLAMSKYWSRGTWFWLRSPYGYRGFNVLHAYPGDSVNGDIVNGVYAVQPASNLNLSSVLFASSAKAASSDTVESGRIADGTAMTLRLDTSATDPATAVGTVIYDASGGVIAAQKNADATGTVSLVVQGKGTIGETEQDWYYSVPVGGTIVVTKEQIQQELSLSAAPNLADCQIWLETTIDNVAYASTAEAVGTIQVEKVNSVAVTDVKPVGGEAFNTAASCNTKGIASITPAITYTTAGENGEKEVTGIADWNTTYKAAFTLTTGIVDNVAYVFGDSVSVTVDEESLSNALAPRVDGTVTVTREFTTAKRKIVSVAAPEVPTDNTFTTYYGYKGYTEVLSNGGNNELGKQATVTLEGTGPVPSTTEDMDVIWTVANAGGAPYDKTPGAENTFRWTIPASEFPNYDASACQGYDAATGDITDTVTITNKAATPVTITGTDSGIAYTGATIDVSDYFDIDTNAGAATYSLVTGVDGGTGVGTLSGTTLTVTKTGTFKIKVETLANGIYGAGEKTITLTVSNGTIEYTATDYSGTYDGQPHSISVNVTNPEGTIISYSTDGENYGSDNPSFTNAGTYTVYYRITKDNYNTISKNSTVNVAKAASAPNKPDSTMDVDYGKEKVSDITTLPEGWAWQDEDQDKALTVGTAVAATAVYTGADKGNYEVESVEISITRAECTHETTEVKNEKDATCTEKGYTGDTCCTVCGKVITAGTDINALGHDFADTFTTDKEATCKEAGSKSKHCSRCDEVKEVTPIPKKEHTWDAGEVTKEATCVEKGVLTYTCEVCHETKTADIAINPNNHTGETEVVGAKDATCKEAGFTGDTKCKDCGETLIPGTVIDKLTTHSYVNGVCSVCDDIFKTTVDGVTYQVMTETGADGKPVGKLVTVSGNGISQVAVAVTGTDDNFAVSDGKVTVPSEITGSGSEQTFVVTKLSENAFNGASVTEVVVPATVTEVGTGAFGTASTITFKGNTAPSGIAGAITETVTTVNVPEGAADSFKTALGENANIVEVHTHTFDTKWTYDETYHWHVATCGHAEEVSDKAVHTFGEWTVTKEATEDAEGVKERSCSCGYKETAKIDKLAHTIHVKDKGTRVEPTCEKKGSITYKCTKCGEVMEVVELDATGHKWDAGKVTKEATETAEGVKTYTCSVCGKTKTEAIPKKEATTQEPPKKGDVVADDKASVTVEVTDVTKKEVTYKEPDGKKAKTVSIPATVKINGVTYKVTKIADNAFKNNKTVTKVTVGSNIKTIGKNAFYKCTKLKTVKIGKNVTEIGANAFKGCSSLTSVTLGSKATKIGANAFNGCKKLKTIKITSTKLSSKTVAKNAFKGLTKATTIKVPKKKLSAYKKLFKQKGLSSKVKVKGY